MRKAFYLYLIVFVLANVYIMELWDDIHKNGIKLKMITILTTIIFNFKNSGPQGIMLLFWFHLIKHMAEMTDLL